MSKWVIGKYIRLSQADRDLMKKENKSESESVSHQRALIQNFINGNAELSGSEQYEFFDDGYTGTNFERPSFERLLEKIKKGEINCVVVKDFSRFGRNYIELGDYLERIFPFMGVRFISINDHYDSTDYKGTTGGLDVVMKNIVYDYYSKDLSVKVKTAKRQKMKQGKYLGGHVPYGYVRCKDDRNKIEPDPEAAAVVKEIFDAAIGGMRPTEIGRLMNERGNETPSAYYRRMNPKTKKFADASEYRCWDINAIRRILQNRVYYGAVVGHKREQVSACSRHSVKVPEEEQVIVENVHQGIVTKEEFQAAQKIFRRRYDTEEKKIEKDYPLYGKVKCGVCGRAMAYRAYGYRGRQYKYFICPHAKNQLENQCCKHYIHEEMLNDVVWQAVKQLLSMADNAQKKIRDKAAEEKNDNFVWAQKLADLQKDKEKCESDRFANVDLFMAGSLDKAIYQSRRQELNRKAEKIEKQIAEMEQNIKATETASDDGTAEAIRKMKKFSDAEQLDQKMVQALVDKVLVTDPEHVEIKWAFGDEIYKFIME